MDFDEITRILEMMRQHDLIEFELERDNVKLRLQKAAPHALPALESLRGARVATAGAAKPAAPAPEAVPVDDSLVHVTSPIVGTFYRASEPGVKPFTDVGERVTRGQVVCIIEAMKLMNEINAEVDGEVVEVHVENGQAVQYGDRLFAIRPA